MIKPLISAGTSRGGTTFLARILSVNNNAKMASDPFLPLFKRLRNQIYETNNIAFSPDGPSSDYYFSDEKLKVMDLIQESNLNLEFPQADLLEIKAALKNRMGQAAPELAEHFNGLHGRTFFDLFANSIQRMAEIYACPNSSWCGFNDNWVSEYFPLFARAFTKAKFISIIRNPRGSIASLTKAKDKRLDLIPPVYAFTRSWRKHVDFTIYMRTMPLFQDRLYVLLYENLVRNPAHEIRKICEFLDIEFSGNMLDTLKFRPMRGNKWEAYSHFKEEVPNQGIYTNAVDRWKTFLQPQVVEFVEFVCGLELDYLGFERIAYHGGSPTKEALRFAECDLTDAQGWHLPMEELGTEVSNDLRRYELLEQRNPWKEEIRRSFLFSEVFHALRE